MEEGCDFVGDQAIQAAVDAAADGDTIHLRTGRYTPRSYRDVGFQDLLVRGYVVVQSKKLTLTGEPGTVLDGARGARASAIVVKDGDLTVRGLGIEGFRVLSPDDDIYDGHGVFVIDSTATLTDLTFRSIEKMALSIRGDSSVEADEVRLLDGHLGVWIEEDARLRLSDCVIGNNDSAGVAAYMTSRAAIERCVFDGNLDDGVYAAGKASVRVADSLFVRNRPYAVRGIDDSVLLTRSGFFYGNAAVSNRPEGGTPELDANIVLDY